MDLPPSPPVDRFDRGHTDLRASLTDRRDPRRTSRVPAEGPDRPPRPGLLTDEVARPVDIAGPLDMTGAVAHAVARPAAPLTAPSGAGAAHGTPATAVHARGRRDARACARLVEGIAHEVPIRTHQILAGGAEERVGAC
ncbi:DUF6457 domain-containing protein [Streptomyces sp. NPDC035033]|uniref:DUF6457 domain-containing protein n=1 Tax=Streptomyces sp. NPDC035033 TaxID=3155368 RepID=UPI0033D4CEC4